MKLDPKLQAQLGQMFVAPNSESELSGALLMVDVAQIHTAVQPRQQFDTAALNDLENSIRALHIAGHGIGGTGILQPLLVRPAQANDENAAYIVTAGERRLRAARAAGLLQVPVIVADSSDEEAWEQAIIENLLRADLSPLEEAAALQKLMQTRGYSVREAARRLGKGKGYLENRLFLLKAPPEIQEMVSARADTIRHAREISKLENLKLRRKLAQSAIDGASFETIQSRVQQMLQSTSTGEKDDELEVSAPADASDAAKTALQVLAEENGRLSDAIKALKSVARGDSDDSMDEKAKLKLASQLEKRAVELQKIAAQLRS